MSNYACSENRKTCRLYALCIKLFLLTCQEMASNEMKQLREKLTKEAIDDHQIAKTGGTPTDLFRCSKCRQNKCTYTQVSQHEVFYFLMLSSSLSLMWSQTSCTLEESGEKVMLWFLYRKFNVFPF